MNYNYKFFEDFCSYPCDPNNMAAEGSTVRKEPSHPLSRELSQRESLWTRSSIFKGMGFARCGAASNLHLRQPLF